MRPCPPDPGPTPHPRLLRRARLGIAALAGLAALSSATAAGAAIDVRDFVAGPSVVAGGLLWSGTHGVTLSSAHRSRLIARVSEVAASDLALSAVHVEDGWTVVAAASLRVGRTGRPLHFISGLAHCGPGGRARWLAATAGGYIYTIVRGDCLGRSGERQFLVRIRQGTGTVEPVGAVPSQALALAAAGGRIALVYEDKAGPLRVDVVSAATAKGLYSFSEPAPAGETGRHARYEYNDETQLDAAGDVVVSEEAEGFDPFDAVAAQPCCRRRPNVWWGNGASHGAHPLGDISNVALSDGRIGYDTTVNEEGPHGGTVEMDLRDLARNRVRTIVRFPGTAHVLGVGLGDDRLAWAQQSSHVVVHENPGGESCQTVYDSPVELREIGVATVRAPLVIEGRGAPPPGRECNEKALPSVVSS